MEGKPSRRQGHVGFFDDARYLEGREAVSPKAQGIHGNAKLSFLSAGDLELGDVRIFLEFIADFLSHPP